MTYSAKTVSAEDCFHLVLIAMSPLQKIFDRPGLTHEFCNQQALSILRNDGFSNYADLLHPYMAELNLGVYWADKDWKNVHHYFEPCTGKGLWQFTNAVDNFNMYYELALRATKLHNFKKAVFFLGAASHLVQDLCVPHHAKAKLLSGHKAYEGWAQERYDKYAAQTQGFYNEGRPAASLLVSNAYMAADFFDWVKHDGDYTLYDKATSVLLPQAQRTTAGLFRHFASQLVALGLTAPKVIVA